VPDAEATITAIESVYRRQYGRFLRVAQGMVGDRERAHDAVQEAFARAIRGRSSFRGEGSVEAWLWRTLANVCADERRSLARAAPPAAAPTANGEEEGLRELRVAVAALPERQRLIVFLRHFADLDYETIAAAAGVERGTVAATLHQAHASLRRALTEVTP
jgi:RNA polymerase sigma-70 factor (ECF subfamily)